MLAGVAGSGHTFWLSRARTIHSSEACADGRVGISRPGPVGGLVGSGRSPPQSIGPFMQTCAYKLIKAFRVFLVSIFMMKFLQCHIVRRSTVVFKLQSLAFYLVAMRG